jgi:hypothetical protein
MGLSSCGWISSKPPIIKYTHIEAPLEECLNPPQPDQLVLRKGTDFKAFVYNGVPYIAPDVDAYENISINMQDVLARLKQGKKVNAFYDSCIRRMIEYQQNMKKSDEDNH